MTKETHTVRVRYRDGNTTVFNKVGTVYDVGRLRVFDHVATEHRMRRVEVGGERSMVSEKRTVEKTTRLNMDHVACFTVTCEASEWEAY